MGIEGYEEYESWKSRKNSISTKFFKNVNAFQYFLIVAGIFLYIMIYRGSANRNLVVALGVCLVLIIFYFFKNSGSNEPITAEQAMIIAKKHFDSKIGTDYLTGTEVDIGPHCKMRKKGDVPQKWEVQYTLRKHNNEIEEGMVEIDVLTGNIVGIVDMPTGYTGSEAGDIEYIMPSGYVAVPESDEDQRR